MAPRPYDLPIVHGRVIDPENAVDAKVNIGITDGRIVYLGDEAAEANSVIDAAGKIVTPGFIDLHCHAQDLAGHRLQALDGVTTSLELEGGAAPALKSYDWAAGEGRPLVPTRTCWSSTWAGSRPTPAAPVTPSGEINHVLVGGTEGVRNSELLPEQRPGQPLRQTSS